MALFRVANERAQFDAASNDARDQYGAGIRFTQEGNARVTTSAGTFYNQGIPMSGTGQVAIVDATAGLPSGTIYHNGLPMSGDKVCVSKNATAVVSNGLPFDSAGALAADINFDLNFIGTDTLNSSVTFTRASTARYFNSAGVLTSAAINEARFDYNPTTLAARGLLIEEQRTNQILQSEDFSTTWALSTGNPTITTNAIVAPDGTLTADKLVEGTSNGGQNVLQSNVSFASGTNAYSVFAKAGERYKITLNESTTLGAAVLFDLSAGTVLSSTGGGSPAPSGQIQAVGNGWYRCTMLLTQASTANRTARIYVVADATTTAANSILSRTGDGTSGLYIWGAQIEAGAFPTSYIPTTTTALTRSADVASVNTLSPWYNATESTLYLEFIPVGLKSAAGQPLLEIDNGSLNERIRMLATSANQLQNATTVAGTVSGSNITPATTYVAGSTYKIAAAIKLDDMQSFSAGVAGVVDTTTLIPTGLTTLRFAMNQSGGMANIWFRRFTYYPRRLSQAEGIAITA